MPEKTKATQPESEKRKRMRSPAYPFVNLETAIKRAKEFYDKEQRNAAPIKVAAKHWNYEEKSSGGIQTTAALISFGLMQDEGTGEKRKLKLTDTALRILLDNRAESEERKQTICTAALTPKIHRQIWKKWGNDLPSDDNLKHTLQLDWKPPFNPKAVDGFIKEYKDTIAFAKPDPSVTVSVEDDESDTDEEEDTGRGKGSVQGYRPKIGELTLQAKPASAEIRVPLLSEKHAMRQDVFSLVEGTVTIQWPAQLSTESIQDLKDWLKIVERKIARSGETQKPANEN